MLFSVCVRVCVSSVLCLHSQKEQLVVVQAEAQTLLLGLYMEIGHHHCHKKANGGAGGETA